MEEISLGKGRFTDQFAIIGRLHQIRLSFQNLEKTATEVMGMFSEGVNDESHTSFLWQEAEAQQECSDIKKAVEDIKFLLRAMKGEVTTIGKE